MNPAPIVDIHTHAFADALAPRAVTQLAEDSGFEPWHDGTVSGLKAAAERAGIDICVIQPVATKPTQVCNINDWALATRSERIRFFGSMHPDFEDPATEIARIARLGLKGIKLHTEYQTFKPDEDRMAPIYEACIENGVFILFHAGADEFLPTLYGRCDHFVAMLDRWPALRCILAHMGGYQQWRIIECELAGRDCWFDTSYSLGYMPEELFLTIGEKHGWERVLFGSDSPWDDMATQLQRVRDLPLSEEQRDAIAGGNAARLLGL